MSVLFQPIRFRDVELRNRIIVSPMCQYSATDDGFPTDWHLVHLGARAVGGAGMVMAEATAVSPEGRISPWDLGIWSDAHAEAYRRITSFIAQQGAVPAMQLAHAGRKASTHRPWQGGKPVGPDNHGWTPVVAPSAIPYNEGYPVPHEMTLAEVRQLVDDFAAAARRAASAGFRAVEVHAAHGYLLHEFLSPLSNLRDDEYGGTFERRTRVVLEVARAVREAFPAEFPVFVRLSASEYVDGGWEIDQSVALAGMLKDAGIDLIDASSGGNLPHQRLQVYPGYQVPFARAIRERAHVATGAVGLITAPQQAEAIVAGGDADVVLLAREILRDPNWPLRAAHALRAEITWPVQYERARF
ncbi:MAG: NADH:flavin oxidoreductase/NADH oxidase [Dehalococcoidia bacterium]|nr:NADH:flavin oxidoreductase/NADH oxidase [Dehalococcoidia bacterium]